MCVSLMFLFMAVWTFGLFFFSILRMCLLQAHIMLLAPLGAILWNYWLLSPFHLSSNTPLNLVFSGVSQKPHCFVLKVHCYFAFKWLKMQMYAALWVGVETDTGKHCPLRGQGAVKSCDIERMGWCPHHHCPSLSTKHRFSLHNKRWGPPSMRERLETTQLLF